ncbi:MAG: right-handed parallel beta-helix repeat-containing protein, partial [Prevotellaceae bacterium]|nr:right-handed parallel beta-helix repeat-containing protein [Prevotellaceae bacterium]
MILFENFRLRIFRTVLLIAVILTGTAKLYGKDYYVKVNGSGKLTGTNWTHAMDNRSFAHMLLTAEPGDVFHLAAGTYVPYLDIAGNEPGNKRAKTFLIRNGVSIQGGYDSAGKPITDEDAAIAAVKLTGVLEQDNVQNNVYHVVTVANDANNAATPMLRYLTVADGYANGGGDNSKGAGIFVGINAGAKEAIKFSHIKVSNNQSNFDGCGIYINSNAVVVIDSSKITDNTRIAGSDVWGGGISVVWAQLDIRNSIITGNAANHGGAIHVIKGQLTSSHCVYDNNVTGTHGGAFDIYDYSTATFDSDIISRNNSPEGGGIHNESYSEINLIKCILTGNSANEGGGFFNPIGCRATIDSCTIEKNTAQRGAGIDNRGYMTVAHSRITDNTASAGDANGGGINQRGTFIMSQSEISRNTAKNGGGVYAENNLLEISNTTISENTATADGGGIFHRYDKCMLDFVTVAGNKASKNRGSGIFTMSLPSINNSIISGNDDNDDISGNYLSESGDKSSTYNIIGTMYYLAGNRNGNDVKFDAKHHLGALTFNRGANTQSHALIWRSSSTDNPAVGKAMFDTNFQHDQTGAVRSERHPSPGAYEETLFKAFNDFISTDGKSSASIDILANDSYSKSCVPNVTIITQSTLLAMDIQYINNNLVYKPRPKVKGFDTIKYRIQCGKYEDSAIVVVEIGIHRDRPDNIKEGISCMEDMPPVKFNVQRKIFNKQVRVDGFSIPLVGDINGDNKPEIIGLGAVSDGGGDLVGLDAVGKSIVIYDGQTGDTLLNFHLNRLGNNAYTSNNGYGTQFGFQLRYEPRHNSYSHLAIANLDGEGAAEIVVAETGSGRVYALKPVLDKNLNIITLEKIWDAKCSHRLPYPIDSKSVYQDNSVHAFGAPVPYISDLNGDGIPEIIVYNKIYNGLTGELVLELETLDRFADPSGTSASSNYNIIRQSSAYVGRIVGAEFFDDCIPAIAINDIDNDGIMEIIAGSKIYKPDISNTNTRLKNRVKVIHGPESVKIQNEQHYLTDGFTVVADIDGDNVSDIIVVKRYKDRSHFVIYVWDSQKTGNESLKAVLTVEQTCFDGQFSIPFVGDINGRIDGWDSSKGEYNMKLPEICMTIGKLNNSTYPITNHPLSSIPNYTDATYITDEGQIFLGHVMALTYNASEKDITKRLQLSWLMKHSDRSHQTGIVMFDFDADGTNELVYRDELSLRVISPANRADGYDFVSLATADPNVIRFKETGIYSYTGWECPVVADVNSDGSADIITFALESTSNRGNSSGYLYVYESAEGSWAPARPVWNQGIYYPLQINDNLTVPRRPVSTLTKYYSKLPKQPVGETIQPFNGNWIQQPTVRTNNYVPVMMTPDPSISMEGIKIISSSKKETKIRITVENRGKASANTKTPAAFYHTKVAPENIIQTFLLNRDVFPDENVTLEYILQGDWREKIICARLVDDGKQFPAKDFFDCDPTNNIAYTMHVDAIDDYVTLASNEQKYMDISNNDIYNNNATPQIEIIGTARHGLSLVSGSKISYLSNHGFQGIDTIRYRIRCTNNDITASDEATVYVLTVKPVTMEYVACPGAVVDVELSHIAGVRYDWYASESGSNVLPNGTNTPKINVTKGSGDEAIWAQTVVNGFDNKFPRFKVDLLTANNCNNSNPSDCMLNGMLLFHEDFGGNSPSDIKEVKKSEQFYNCQLDDLCEGTVLDISSCVTNVSNGDKVNLTFVTEDLDGNVLSKYYTGNMNADKSQKNYGFSFTVPDRTGSIVLKIFSSDVANAVIAVDDIMIYLCTPKIGLNTQKLSLCIGDAYSLEGNYPAKGNTFGADIEYRWEFRHIDSVKWKTVAGDVANPPLHAVMKIANMSKANDGYYRLRISKLGNIGSKNCCAVSNSVRIMIGEATKVPDIRIQLSPIPKRVVNLTSFIDSINYASVEWNRVSHAPAFIAGTNKTTGSVNSNDFKNISTYTYKYTVASRCGSSEAKAYIRTVKDRIFRTPNIITVCRTHESSQALNLKRILGLELDGAWLYGTSVNPDATVTNNVTVISPPSKYAAAIIFNATKAWETASSSYSISYQNYSNAKAFKFIYIPAKGSKISIEKELVIIVTD